MKIEQIVEIIQNDELNNLDSDLVDCLQFSPVKFLIDFGPFKANQYYECIAFDLWNGTIKEYNQAGEIVQQAELIFSAK